MITVSERGLKENDLIHILKQKRMRTCSGCSVNKDLENLLGRIYAAKGA